MVWRFCSKPSKACLEKTTVNCSLVQSWTCGLNDWFILRTDSQCLPEAVRSRILETITDTTDVKATAINHQTGETLGHH